MNVFICFKLHEIKCALDGIEKRAKMYVCLFVDPRKINDRQRFGDQDVRRDQLIDQYYQFR